LARDCRTGVNTARILILSQLFPGLRPLRHRDFALYFSGLTVSQIGDWMETTTTSWLLYQITADPILLGLAGAIRAASIIIFGLFGGAIADRTDRRRLLFVTQSGFALSSLVLGTLVLGGWVLPWHIYVFSGVNGALGSFDAPARRALFPGLVPRAEMQSAVVLNGAVFRLGRLVGPAIAGVVIAAFGPAVSYFVNVESYAAILVAASITDAYWTAMRNTMFQLQTDEAHRGRTLSTVLLAGRGFTQAAQFESGIAVAAGGPHFALASGAAAIALVLVAV